MCVCVSTVNTRRKSLCDLYISSVYFLFLVSSPNLLFIFVFGST